MPLTPGTRLGPYEVVSALGAGGMGEVYRARDTRLDRSVAIKVLAAHIIDNRDLRARFEREARAVAALEHPHICGIYDVGEAQGQHFLVMPLLEGQTLAERIQAGKLPLNEALKIATDIADALDKAHRHGIVHRDLKPANIMLTKSGAKLLDFGLAKLNAPVAAIFTSSVTRLPTSEPQTALGTILGTVQYMAPEQLEGKDADARSDIWSLGTVMYEMVTGTRPFKGDTPASIVGAILKDDPPPVSAGAPLAPPLLDHLIRRCLDKQVDSRWQSAADLRDALQWVNDTTLGARGIDDVSSRTRTLLAIASVGALLLVALVMFPGWWAHRREPRAEVTQLSLPPPPNTTFSSPPASVVAPQIAVSPDGRRIAVVAEAPRGRPSLWVRPLDSSSAQLLVGAEDATYPFWSPDSKSIGFFAQGKLKTIEVVGGPARTLSDAPLDSRGGTWSPNGTIVFSPGPNNELYRVAATGGPTTRVTRFDASRTENSHRFPSFLPDGRHFLFTTRSKRSEYWGISVASIDSQIGTPLIERTEWSSQFVAPGYVLFLRGGTLMAQAFDANRLALTGEPVSVASGIGATTTAYAAFSASNTGTLAHANQIGLRGELRWFDRAGNPHETVGPPAEYLDFELSPDERTLAVSRVDPKFSTADVWLFDLARNVDTRFTSDPVQDASALWSPDGTNIIFRSNRHGTTELFQRRSSGTAAEKVVHDPGTNVISSDWSVDGKYIVYTNTASPTGFDIWVWPTTGNDKPQIVVRTPLNDMHGRLSPDSRWLAYASDESGEMQVWVQPFPPTGEKRQMSPDGGSEPRWRRDGNELFYLAASGKLTSVAVPGGNPFKAGAVKALFDTRVPLTANPYRTNYTVTADGERFLVNTRISAAPTLVNVILQWPALLKK